MIPARFKNLLKREVLKFSPYHQWYSKDPKFPIDGKRKRLLIKNGFYPSDDLVFDFEKYGMENYLNTRDYFKIHPLNGAISALIDNKAFLPVLLQSQSDLLPELFIYLSNGQLKYSRGMEFEDFKLENLLKATLEKFGTLIAKPTGDGGGRNIFRLNKENLKQGIERIKKGDYVLNNVLVNDPFSKEIYPNSLNTLRVVFYKNRQKVNTILMIAHRFGNSVSNGVDNTSSGGMACSVNIQTGRLSKAYSFHHEPFLGWHTHHMDTGTKIENATIPDWKTKLNQIQALVSNLDFLEYAGMDLAFTVSGLKVIEINSLPESKLMQVGGPAFLDQEFKEFILSKGYKVR